MLSNALPDYLHNVPFRRYSPLSLEFVEKPNKCKSFFAPNFFSGGDPNCYTADCYRDLPPPFGKVWLSSVCWCPSAKPGNEVKQNLRRVAKIAVQFEAVCGPKFISF